MKESNIQVGLDLTLESFLYIITRGNDWSQITDREFVSAWTSGDWKEFYYVFTSGNGLRLEFFNCNERTVVSLYSPSEKAWSCIYEFTVDLLHKNQLVKLLDRYDIMVTNKEVYSE